MGASPLSSQVGESIRALSRDTAQHAHDGVRAAARLTGGVPVYWDFGGVLAVTPDGGVAFYDPETGEVSAEREEGWRTLALVKAAQKYPELQALLPERPGAAVTCSHCGGSGTVLGHIPCGACFGAGWIKT